LKSLSKKNTNLKEFYNKSFKKGEEKVFTVFHTRGTNTVEMNQVINSSSWKGKSVLDVGCGTGGFAFKIAKKGAKVLGIDYSKEAIKIASEQHKHKNLQFLHADINKNLSGKYDIITSIGTLEHMDNPLKILKSFKKHLSPRGKIIITSPNWTNSRGYILISLYYLFNAPITMADLHYQTPIDFQNYAKSLNMRLKWNTFDESWANGDVLLKDFERRLPNVLRDAKLPKNMKNIKNLLDWIEKNVLPFNNKLKHSGATGIYIFTLKSN